MTELNGEIPSDQWHSRLHSNPLWVKQGDEMTDQPVRDDMTLEKQEKYSVNFLKKGLLNLISYIRSQN